MANTLGLSFLLLYYCVMSLVTVELDFFGAVKAKTSRNYHM